MADDRPPKDISSRRVSRTDAQTLTEAQRIQIEKQQKLSAYSSSSAGRASAEADPQVDREVDKLLAELDGEDD